MLYIMACDERGTNRWPSRTKTWAQGGFIVDSRRRPALLRAWTDIKSQLCGTNECELKWSHFFPGNHQRSEANPLLSSDPTEWRKQARWAVSELFYAADMLPVTTLVRKDRASPDAFVTTRTGGRVLDIDILWVPILGQFAIFLRENGGMGELWFDQLGSRKEEARRQESWRRLRDDPWPLDRDRQALLRAIGPSIRFFDSRKEPVVQLADFVSGVIWAAAEGDESFLRSSLQEYFPMGRHSYSLLSVV
jgi:hypothetical protein